MQRLPLKPVQVAVVTAYVPSMKIHVPVQRIVRVNVVETAFVMPARLVFPAPMIVGNVREAAVFRTIRPGALIPLSPLVYARKTSIAATWPGDSNVQGMLTNVEAAQATAVKGIQAPVVMMRASNSVYVPRMSSAVMSSGMKCV